MKNLNTASEEEQLEVVKQDGYYIQHIKNPSEEVKLEAVKQKAWSIFYLKNPCEKVQLEAIKQNGRSIQFIKNLSTDALLLAYAVASNKNDIELKDRCWPQPLRLPGVSENTRRLRGQCSGGGMSPEPARCAGQSVRLLRQVASGSVLGLMPRSARDNCALSRRSASG